jgi:histidinol-phosphate phosphatase family protein
MTPDAAAAFLDKDGTLVRDVPYNVDPERIELLPGVGQGLRLLQEAGFRLVVISNQSGVARGLFPMKALAAVAARLRELVASFGVTLDAFYWCPLAPDASGAVAARCDCRKPRPGLLQRAARELRIDLARSWMIGDILNDVEAGHRAGCRAILVDRGGETEWLEGPYRTPELVVGRFDAAARAIVAARPIPVRPPRAREPA